MNSVYLRHFLYDFRANRANDFAVYHASKIVRKNGFPVVFSGGVASNSQLRESCKDFDAIFAPPEYSTDNAMGIAVLTWLQGA